MPRWLSAYGCPVEPHQVQLRCAAVAAWTSAALRGDVSLDRVLDVLRGLPGGVCFRAPLQGPDPQPLAIAVGSWRSRGVGGWRYVPVAPGDSGGMPGPRAVAGRAGDAGAALVSVSGPTLALLPETPATTAPTSPTAGASTVFDEVPTDGHGAAPPETLAELDRSLLTALTEATERLGALEVARWRDQVAELMASWGQVLPMPPGTGERAERLAARAGRILALVDLAASDTGGSRTAAEMGARAYELRDVARAARAAHAAAWNCATLGARSRS